MKYAIDTEFIDTPDCSALISLGIVAEDGRELYFEFPFNDHQLTPWLRENVVPHLGRPVDWVTLRHAARAITEFVGADKQPQFWCYFGAYDWYWFCRLWGGFMEMPQEWPHLFHELAWLMQPLPNVSGAEHNALNDARSVMAGLKVALGRNRASLGKESKP